MDDGRSPLPVAQGSHKPLTVLEGLSISSMVGGEAAGLRQALSDLALDLEGPERDATRLSVVAHALASARLQLGVLEALYSTQVRARDMQGVALVGKALRDTTARVARLAEAHAAVCSRERRPVVLGSPVVRVQER
jgi:hypothetical protein